MVFVQVTFQPPDSAVQVLGGAKSDAYGVAVLTDLKLRARPGNYSLLVASTTDKSVAPAHVSNTSVPHYKL